MRILFKTDKWNHLCCVGANVPPDVCSEHIFMWSCSILTSAESNGPHLKDRKMMHLHTKGTDCAAPAFRSSVQSSQESVEPGVGVATDVRSSVKIRHRGQKQVIPGDFLNQIHNTNEYFQFYSFLHPKCFFKPFHRFHPPPHKKML